MRPISFKRLHSIVLNIAETFDLLVFRASELNELILDERLLSSKKSASPSPTSLYHYRNTLVKLGILNRKGRLLQLNTDNPTIRDLTNQKLEEGSLSHESIKCYQELLFLNSDCRKLFLDYFMPQGGYTIDDFFKFANFITWKDTSHYPDRHIIFRNPITNVEFFLKTPSQIQAILYGLRYWGRNELTFLDEFFREDCGAILFPINDTKLDGKRTIFKAISKMLKTASEWTTLSVRDLAFDICVPSKLPLALLFGIIEHLSSLHSGLIALIPTATPFAAIGARSLQRERFELRSYIKDHQGRIISHVRVHKNLREVLNGYGNRCL